MKKLLPLFFAVLAILLLVTGCPGPLEPGPLIPDPNNPDSSIPDPNNPDFSIPDPNNPGSGDSGSGDNGFACDSYFWGEWTRMDNGKAFTVKEAKITYDGYDKDIVSSTATTLEVSGIGTFVKESDSVMVRDNIPYFRNGGTNLEYKLKVVGFTDSSRAAATKILSRVKAKAKSKTYASFESTAESDSNGELTFTAPTINDVQTVTISNNGNDVVIPDLRVQNSGDFMGTVALVDADQYNLKITGVIEESEKNNGYLYANDAKAYPMTITITNISEVKCTTSVCKIEADDPKLILNSSAYLEGITVSTLPQGGTKEINLTVQYGELTQPYIDTGITITIKNPLSGQTWTDYIPLRFFKGTIPIAVSAKSPESNLDAALNGFVIYPDGNNQFFSIRDRTSKVIYVPTFGDTQKYKMIFSGATVTEELSASTEMYYTVAAGTKTPRTVVTEADAETLIDFITFGGDNHTESAAYDVNEDFEAYLNEGAIDYYSITADSDEFYSPTGSGFYRVTYASEYDEEHIPESFSAAEGTSLNSSQLPELTQQYMTFDGWYDGNTKVNAGSYAITDPVTLTAKWSYTQYSITYDLNGGTNAPENPSTYTYASEEITFASPTKSFYDFAGWYENPDFNGEPVTGIPTGSSEAKSFYAKWTPTEYTIMYILDDKGNNAAGNPATYNVDSEDIILQPATSDDYVFCGWFDNEYCNGYQVSTIETASHGDITLYAKWIPTEYTITYVLDDKGNNAAGNPATYNVDSEDIILQPATSDDYVFCGWFDNEYCNGYQVSTIETASHGDITLYAKWTPTEYTIMYILDDKGNNAAGNPVTYNVDSETIILLPATSDDYGFGGWFDNEYCNGYQVSTIETGSHGDITLYAKWIEKRNITYVSEHGTQPEALIVAEGTILSDVQLPELTDAAYYFKGWYTEDTYDNKALVNVCSVSGNDVTLYAKWLKKCTITYASVYNCPEQIVVEEGNLLTSTEIPTLHHKGYLFKGWFTGSAYTNRISAGDVISDSITLYAKWEGVDDGFVFVEGETFTMGRTTGSGDSDETPTHSVTVSDFYMSPYELTQSIYTEIMVYNPSYFTDSGDRPVEKVSWYDAIYFCNKYSESVGLTPCYKVNGSTAVTSWGYVPHNGNSIRGTITCDFSADGYRLPTEAEWEYAAKGGKNLDDYLYSGSDTVGNVAWYGSNASSQTHQVGLKDANILGLYDMSGNVYEWCWDWYGSYSSSPTDNPAGPSSGSSRVSRGGSWYDDATYVRCADRYSDGPNARRHYIGFRLVRSGSN